MHILLISQVQVKTAKSDCYLYKGVGEGGGGGGHVPPHFQKWGAQVGLSPPPLLGIANVLISLFAHFVVKNTFFSKFSWLASLANFNKSIFSKLC